MMNKPRYLLLREGLVENMTVLQFKHDKRISETHRKELRLHCSEAGRRIDDLARKLGVLIEAAILPRGHRAALVKSPNCGSSSGYKIVVEARLPFEQRNVNIAHELGHFVLHRNDKRFEALSERQLQCLIRGYDIEDSCDIGEVVKLPNGFSGSDTPHVRLLEKEANDFAVCILMPQNLVRKSVNFRVKQIPTLAREFGVPRSIAERRANRLSQTSSIARSCKSSEGTEVAA